MLRRLLAAGLAAAMVLGASGAVTERTRLAAVGTDRLDDLMLLPRGENRGWVPTGPADLRYPWPEQFAGYWQPFDPWTFAKNAAALLDFVGAKGRTDTAVAMAAFLAARARTYTRVAGGCTFITNDFDYPYFWSHFRRGFTGAFMNAVTAYGYLLLYDAIGLRSYLGTADDLLRGAADCRSGAVRLSSIDGNGHFWLNEYVFEPPDEDRALFRWLGFEQNEDGSFRARIYNGHIHALLAFIRYARMTGSTEFDGVIARAIATMRAYLPDQLRPEGFFAYGVEVPQYPDYGPYRAVALAAALCTVSGDETICASATRMRAAYEGSIRESGAATAEAAYRAVEQAVIDWRRANP